MCPLSVGPLLNPHSEIPRRALGPRMNLPPPTNSIVSHSFVQYQVDYPNKWGRATSGCGKLMKVVLNFFMLRNLCHQKIQE